MDKKLTKTMNSSEALYGFMGWLTIRSEVVTTSAAHDCSDIATLIDTFCRENNLPQPREDWLQNLTHPKT